MAVTHGRTPLHLAAAANRLDECLRLLQMGFNAAARDRLGITPLDEAEARGFTDIAALLRRHFTGERRCWTRLELSCPVCFGLLWMPIEAGECGHLFCRSCLQLSRRATGNGCPVCRAPVTLPTGYQPNIVLMHLARSHLHLTPEYALREIEQRSNAAEIAIANLVNLGIALGIGDRLTFNATGSCCLLIDGEFFMHVTLLPTRRLFVYSPVLEGLPASQLARLALCERILLGALESAEDAPGSVGILREQQFIILHRELSLNDPSPDALRLMSGAFVKAVKRWRMRLHQVLQTAEGVALAPASPATKRRACRPSPTLTASPASSPSPPRTSDLTSVARLVVAKASIDQFLADEKLPPDAYERSAGALLVKFNNLTIRYLSTCDRMLLTAALLDETATSMDEALRLGLYEELLSASAFGSHTPAGGAALQVRDTLEPQLVLYATIACDRLTHEVVEEFNGAVAAWRGRLQEMLTAVQSPPIRRCALNDASSKSITSTSVNNNNGSNTTKFTYYFPPAPLPHRTAVVDATTGST